MTSNLDIKIPKEIEKQEEKETENTKITNKGTPAVEEVDKK